MQSFALNFMQRGDLTHDLVRWTTAVWTIGTTLAGGIIWWVVLDPGQNWLADQWVATPGIVLSADLMANATSLGAVLGAVVGVLQCPALIHTPRIALLWIILHVVLCAGALHTTIAGLSAYNPENEYARDNMLITMTNAVFLAVGASMVLGGALLAWGIPPAGDPLVEHAQG